MKRRILSSILCGMMTLLFSGTFLQGATTPSAPTSVTPACPLGKCEGLWFHHRQHELEFLTKALNLTPTQQSQIKAILEQRYSQLKTLHEDASISGELRKEKVKEIFRTSHEKLLTTLTPDQKEKMQQIRKRHMEKGESSSNCSHPHCSTSMCPTTPNVPAK